MIYKNLLFFLFFLSLSTYGQGSFTQIGQTIYGEFEFTRLGRKVKINDNGTIIAVSAPDSSVPGLNEGFVKVFELTSENTWEQRGQTLIGPESEARYGLSMDLSADGNIVAIASSEVDSDEFVNAGRVDIFRYDGSSWLPYGDSIIGQGDNDFLGVGLDISSDGSRLAISGNSDDVGSGDSRVVIYEYLTDQWVPLANPIKNSSSSFGSELAISNDGTTVVISANFGGPNRSGLVYAYRLQSGIWTQLGEAIVGEAFDDRFGISISINADGSIISGASRFNSNNGTEAGQIRVYEYTGRDWVQKGPDIYGQEAFERLGIMELDASGNILAISIPARNGSGIDRGTILVLKYIDGEWIQVLEEIEGAGDFDFFGRAIELTPDGRFLIASNSLDSAIELEAGRVQVYSLDLNALPIFSCPDDIIQANDSGSCQAVIDYELPEVTDPEDGSIIPVLVEGLPTGSIFPLGETAMSFEATDSFGDTVSCSFTITVVDNEAPEVTCPADQVLMPAVGDDFVILGDYRNPDDSDLCSLVVSREQLPVPGTALASGTEANIIITNTDEAGNESSCSFMVVVEEVLNVEELIFEDALIIYPNVFNEKLHIKLNNPVNDLDKLELRFMDVNGRVLKTTQNFERNNQELSLDTHDIASGVYFLRISNDEISVIRTIIKR